MHDDLDAAVLRLAHTVAGLHQQALLAAADRRNRCAGTPSRTRASFTAFARILSTRVVLVLIGIVAAGLNLVSLASHFMQ